MSLDEGKLLARLADLKVKLAVKSMSTAPTAGFELTAAFERGQYKGVSQVEGIVQELIQEEEDDESGED